MGSRKAFRSPNALVLNAFARCWRPECRRVYILGPARRRRGLLGSGARFGDQWRPRTQREERRLFVASSAAPTSARQATGSASSNRWKLRGISLWSPRWRASDEARRTIYVPRPRRVLQLDRQRRHLGSLKDLGATRSRRKGVAGGAISSPSHAIRFPSLPKAVVATHSWRWPSPSAGRKIAAGRRQPQSASDRRLRVRRAVV